MKYIDAEKLIAEIARLRKEHTTREYRDEAALVLDDLEDCIDSLQQEQQEKKEVKFVFPKFLYARTTNNKTIDVSYAPQSLDAIEYIRSDSLQQEQPETFDTAAFQKGVQEGRRLEREEMPKWRNYGPNIIKDPFITDLGSLVVGEKCIRIYELYNLPGFKND